jgi:hypothetical protein
MPRYSEVEGRDLRTTILQLQAKEEDYNRPPSYNPKKKGDILRKT